jgi:hypothetical protein
MCIAILNTKGTTLKKEVLRNCWENNGDGAGILYINNDKKLSVFKEMTSFDNFYNNYSEIKSKYGKRNIVLHFRISTHGRVNETNCHPFLVDDSIGFVHNGMIYDVPTSTEFSDTYMFNQTILKNLKEGFEYNETILEMIDAFIGSGSKLVFLNDNDDYFIVNEKAGHWHLGCWFSNTSYQQVNSWVDYGGVKKSKVGYSSSDWGYGSWGVSSQDTWGSKYGSFSEDYIPGTVQTAKSDRDDAYCISCDCRLYGINELNNGVCNWCVEDFNAEQIALEEEEKISMQTYGIGDCEFCEDKTKVGIMRDALNTWVCKDCYRELGA